MHIAPGTKGLYHSKLGAIPARVVRDRHGCRVDLEAVGIDPSQTQQVPVGRGVGCFAPDAWTETPPAPTVAAGGVRLYAPALRLRHAVALVVGSNLLAALVAAATTWALTR